MSAPATTNAAVAPEAPQQQQQQAPATKNPFVFVKGLAASIDSAKLQQIFEAAGHQVKAARVIINKQTNVSKGYGFVEFETEDQANAAVGMNEQNVEGQPIHVEIGTDRAPRRHPRGGFRGGYRGGFRGGYRGGAPRGGGGYRGGYNGGYRGGRGGYRGGAPQGGFQQVPQQQQQQPQQQQQL